MNLNPRSEWFLIAGLMLALAFVLVLATAVAGPSAHGIDRFFFPHP